MSEPQPENTPDYPQPLVSIVMPIRNQERVLRETLECICSQSLRNFELICVDDGSTDSSIEIEREFANRDFRIRLFLRDGEGAARARNFGLSQAAGRYIIFLDSDDLFYPDMLLNMASVLEATDAEICICEAELFDETGAVIPCVSLDPYQEGLYGRHAFGYDSFHIGGGCVWNNMYRREYLLSTGVLFQDIKCHNDSSFAALSIWKASSIYLLKSSLVRYRRGLGTSIQDKKKAYPLEAMKAAEAIFDGAYDPNNLTSSETTSLQMRCIGLLMTSFDTLISAGAYEEPIHRRIVGDFKRWGLPSAARTLSDLKAIWKARFIERATYDEVMWAHSRWTRGEKKRSLPQRIDRAARMFVVTASPFRRNTLR